MRKLSLTIAVLSTALSAGLVSAQSINPGVAQLAASVGVSPTAFTQDQMIQLERAQRENDIQTVNFILSQAQDDVSRAGNSMGISAGETQLALTAGVEPGRFSTNELVRLIAAQRANNQQTIDFILSGTNRVADNPASVVTPAEVQLAAPLGLNPAEYTLTELALLAAQAGSDG
jgi:hypothetical protein